MSGAWAPMRHAIILYSAREGSSVIMSHLRRHPGIAVPLFEQLDHYLVREQVPPERHRHLPAALRRVLRSGRYDPGFFAEGSGEEQPAGQRSTVFKWRGWGLGPPVAEVLAAEGAGLFLLNRRDLLNLGLSLHYGREVIGGGVLAHPQFTLIELPEAERPAYLEALRNRPFRAEPERLAQDMREHVEAKRAVLGAVTGFATAGIPVRPIWYEDYTAAPPAFLAALLNRLGLGLPPAALETEYVKASRADMRTQVENLAELEASPAIREQVEAWRQTCAEIEGLAAGGPT